ncbi:Kruppel-like factor 18 [Apodemus sylvaticus]|uniref:Kruppel-like factor 18 n=1 Tax=Apodemus sylvaticus TaxID=10129 RepID=UPI002244EBE0|nr:Kruppel-like factor 18 [Apodemus sylvaticus]
MEMAENTVASQPGSWNTQPSPMESSQLISGQSSDIPTWKQIVMASTSCSNQDAACTLSSTAHLEEANDFLFGEPSETSFWYQQVVSAEQKISPAGPQHMQLNSTPKTCLSHSQKRAELDTRDTLYNEGYWKRTLNSDKTLLFTNTDMCLNPRINFGNHQKVLSGSHALQDPNVDHSLASKHDQIFSGEHEMPFHGNQTNYNQMTPRNGGHLTLYGNQMTSPSYTQALYPNQIITSFSEQNCFGNHQESPVADNEYYGNQMILSNGNQVFSEPQMRINCDQTNDQMKSFSVQNVFKDQENLLSCEHSFSGYQTSGYRCDQDLIVNHQASISFAGQAFYEFQKETSSFDTTFHGSQRTTYSPEENLASHSETSPSSEEIFYLGQIKTSFDENVCPNQNGTTNLEGSLDWQVTSLSPQASYVDENPYPSSSPLVQRQPQENSSASSLVQVQRPEMKSDTKTKRPVSRKNPHPLKSFSCTYKDCQKSYKKSHHLKNHMKKHTGQKDYACDEPGCKWKFFRSGDLKRHKQKHSWERPYPCDMCNKSYSRPDYLKKHQRSHLQTSSITAT